MNNNQIVSLIDIIRVGSGLPQIFGTQTKIKDDIFYLYPLENEAKVDGRRKLYNLPPLADFIKYLQSKYQTILLKTAPPISPKPKEKRQDSSDTNAVIANPLADLEKEEVIKVESSLVNLNVRVSSGDSMATDVPALKKNDFAVFEDERKQEITFFSTSDTPFDLILLLNR